MRRGTAGARGRAWSGLAVTYAAVSAAQAYLAAATGAAWAVAATVFLAAAIGCGIAAWRGAPADVWHFARRPQRTCSIPGARAPALEE